MTKSQAILGGVLACGLVACVIVPAVGDPPVSDAGVVDILARLDRAGEKLIDLEANMTYSRKQRIKQNPDDPDEVETYIGWIKFLNSKDNANWMIHFKEWNDGRVRNKERKWYIFDGRWLIKAEEPANSILKYELVREGERVNIFKLGEGRFPLPFGQKKADVLKEFDVTLIGPSAADPPNTDHLMCRPKKESHLAERYKTIELYISNDAKSAEYGLPVKIVMENIKEATQETAVFTKFRKNGGLKATDFQLPRDTKGWHTEIERLAPRR